MIVFHECQISTLSHGYNFVSFFLCAKKMIDKLTSADADAWRTACVSEKLAKATIAKRTNVAKTIFKKAVKLGIVKASPFEDLKVGSQVNSEPRTAKLKRCR